MRNIKKFNESKEEKIWCVIMCDSGGFPMEESCKSFYNKMMAADYFIKYINYSEDTEFEPFYELGTRLFLNIDENKDWEKCISYCEANNLDISLLEIPILTSTDGINLSNLLS